jgi:hypothetical protein
MEFFYLWYINEYNVGYAVGISTATRIATGRYTLYIYNRIIRTQRLKKKEFLKTCTYPESCLNTF